MVDVLIVGAGGAGLSAAIAAHDQGASVAVLTKSYPTRAGTSMAQGGMNAVLGEGDDTIDDHVADTLKSSHHLGDETQVRYLCEQAPEAITWLEGLGVPFWRHDDGALAQRRLGGTQHSRALFAEDFTGLKLLHTLYDQANKRNITVYNERFLLNYIVEDEQVRGVTVLNIRTGKVEEHVAKSVIIATGGYTQVYRGFSTNSTESTGDGIAAAIRAGCRLSDLEFIQFHPTTLKSSGILISESARGAGAYLVDDQGERFVDELKPRDEVARAIYEKIDQGQAVFLDMRHLDHAMLEEEMPQELQLIRTYEGVDPFKEPVPIIPVAHYSMGGIEVDKTSQTNVSGLYAAGECANHNVHGANRLGGNSLLEIVVFGRQAGSEAATFAASHAGVNPDPKQFINDKNFINAVFHFTNQIDFYEKRSFLGKIFYRNAGIFRDDMKLKGVLAIVRQTQRELTFMGVADKTKTYNTNLVEFIEFGNILELSEIILVGAISRTESRGAHYREDYPREDDKNFAKHTIMYKEEGVLCTDYV
jgi:succinate dehydrogenase / fumarate reductase flavoprotein subunit